MSTILTWIKDQQEKSKMAWTIIVVIGSIFGYQLSAEKKTPETTAIQSVIESSTLDTKLQTISTAIDNINTALENIDKSVK